MYSLSKVELGQILEFQNAGSVGMQAERAEEMVRQSLPNIAGLESARTDAERLSIYNKTIESQLDMFIERNGSAFGEKEKTENQMMLVPEDHFMSVVAVSSSFASI